MSETQPAFSGEMDPAIRAILTKNRRETRAAVRRARSLEQEIEEMEDTPCQNCGERWWDGE